MAMKLLSLRLAKTGAPTVCKVCVVCKVVYVGHVCKGVYRGVCSNV